MANPEACELWIEQRTDELNNEGTSFEEIGRIVSAELQDVFEAKIKARTIAQRARRNVEKDIVTSVTQKSNNESFKEEIEENSSLEPELETDRGGEREGAGRPKLLHTETHEVTYAMDLAAVAISQLKRIKKDDPYRKEAFLEVAAWIDNNI